MTRRGHVAAAVTMAVAISTSSGGWSSASSVPPTTPNTSESPVATVSADSTAPTSPVSTTSSDSAEPTSGPAESTTAVDPAAALEAAISDAAVHATAAARNALFHPDDQSAIDALDQWYVAGSPARARVERLVQEQRDSARLLRPHPTIADATTIEQVLPGTGDAPTRAGVVVCVVEASEDVATGTGQVGSQDVTSYRTVYEMNLVDGQWQLLTSSVLQTWSSTAQCAPPTEATTLAAEVTMRISEIDAVQAQVVANLDAPGNDELLRSVLTDNGESISGTTEFMQFLRDNGQRLRIEPGRPPAVTVERLDPLDGPPPTRIDALVCGIDPTVLYEPGAGPDGQDAIVNDLISANRLVFHLVFEEGTWQLDKADSQGRWTGVIECPPA